VAVTDYIFPLYAADILDGSVYWQDPQFVKLEDSSFSICVESINRNISNTLRVINFNFSSIPSTSIIIGIEAIISKRRSLGNIFDNSVFCVLSGSHKGDNKANISNWPASETEISYGGPTSLWGWTPLLSDIKDSSFGLDLNIYSTIGIDVYAYINSIKMRIYYSLPLNLYNIYNDIMPILTQ
jgi:hypothetical protein